ncbi:DUF3953 domain-containing protein [Bacillus massiliigorillae]|uniref:DUF3953 domain-containing protein n=1 Tax=Bacillus massiliigorillae TaxID=1243664 RepID=UPI00039EF57D|nr:DUF3953 domain-containing protein [Bacillus massiliigorillae]
MLKTSRIILTIITVGLSAYALITEKYDYNSYTLLLLGFIMLLMGLEELQKDRKNFWGYIGIIASVFVFFVSIKVFLFS